MSGRKNLDCQCSEPVQRAHYQDIGAVKSNDHFDDARAAEATQWLQDFLAEGRGLDSSGSTFTEREVEDAFKKYGRVDDVWVARRPPGFAFVWFGDERDATAERPTLSLPVRLRSF